MGGQGKGPANPDPIAAHPTCRARLRIGERPAPEEPCRFGAGVSQDHPPEPADWDQHGLLPVNLEQRSIPETNLARLFSLPYDWPRRILIPCPKDSRLCTRSEEHTSELQS